MANDSPLPDSSPPMPTNAADARLLLRMGFDDRYPRRSVGPTELTEAAPPAPPRDVDEVRAQELATIVLSGALGVPSDDPEFLSHGADEHEPPEVTVQKFKRYVTERGREMARAEDEAAAAAHASRQLPSRTTIRELLGAGGARGRPLARGR